MKPTELMTSIAIALAVSLPAYAQQDQQSQTEESDAPEPYARQDGSWISISGTVASPTADTFSLDYGDGIITVEMDDWDLYGEAYSIMDGDKVTVYGEVDDDLFEIASIEASSVYVENLNTYLFASAADEEGVTYSAYHWLPSPVVLSQATLRGTVDRVNREQNEFTIDTGIHQLTVETDGLSYNPLDDLGFQRIDSGDRVSVTGEFDIDFLEGQVFEANSLITLADDSDSDSSSVARSN